MTLLSRFTLSALLGLLATGALAAEPESDSTGCTAKRQALETRIEQARAHDDQAGLDGLQQARDQVETHCADSALRKAREQQVLDARHEVAQRKKDLDKAMKKGDPERINKRKEKLSDANKALQDALQDLER
jgi:hypothetical protein